MKPYGLPTQRLSDIRARETGVFEERTRRSAELNLRASAVMPNGVPMQWMAGLYRHLPMTIAGGAGPRFTDVDGNSYLDMNLCDYAATLGFDFEPVAQAVSRSAGQGMSFLLPGEDAIIVAEELAQRTSLPFWQFSGAASSANMEAIRIARLATGRQRILMFEGRYHGHIDLTLADDTDDATSLRGMGFNPSAGAASHTIPFNDLERLKEALVEGDVACVIAEPMLTNCNLVFPDDGFWAQARALIKSAGSLLIIDEAHTHNFAYGGLTTAWKLEPDMMIIGKGMGTGVPFALYGMCEELGKLVTRHLDVDVAAPVGVALGGTTFGSALAGGAARAALEHGLRQQDYERAASLGQTLSHGLTALFGEHDLTWCAPQIGGRTGWHLFPDPPRNAREAEMSLDPSFIDTRRLFMANRGIWEAISSAGPSVSFAHQKSDVDLYLEISRAFLDECLS